MATTTTVDTQAIVAGSGGTSTPVKLTLQGGTQAVSIQLGITTTRAAVATDRSGMRREFTLYWAFSPDDLTLANVPTLLRHCAKSQSMTLNTDIETAGQRQQVRDKVSGQYLYVWFGYPSSLDAYAVVIKTTELFFLSSATDPTFTTITLTGQAMFADGTAAAPSVSFLSDSDTGFYRTGTGEVSYSSNGTRVFSFGSGGYLYGANISAYILMASTGELSFVAAGNNRNITLTPSGTGYLSVANGNAGAGYAAIIKGSATYGLGVYMGNGGTDVSLWSVTNSPLIFGTNEAERMRLFANGRLGIGTGAADSGARLQLGINTDTTSAGGMVFGTDLFLYRNGSNLYLDQSGTTSQYIVSISGVAKAAFGVSSGSTYLDGIGSLILRSNGTTTALTLDASQNATFAGEVRAGTNFRVATASALYWNSSTQIGSPSDGVVRLANFAGTDFTRLQFGGTTASFPALRRNGTALDAVLADNTGFTAFQAANFTAKSAATAVAAGEVGYGGTTATTVGAAGAASALPLTPTGYIIVNVAGTQMKVPYYAN